MNYVLRYKSFKHQTMQQEIILELSDPHLLLLLRVPRNKQKMGEKRLQKVQFRECSKVASQFICGFIVLLRWTTVWLIKCQNYYEKLYLTFTWHDVWHLTETLRSQTNTNHIACLEVSLSVSTWKSCKSVSKCLVCRQAVLTMCRHWKGTVNHAKHYEFVEKVNNYVSVCVCETNTC